MSYPRYGAGLTGLIVMAMLGVMAFASMAQAAPEFLIDKEAVGSLKASFGAEQSGTGSMLMPSLNAEINCSKFSVKEGLINSGTDATVSLLFEECIAREIGGALAALFGCKIIVSAGDPRSHITATGLALPTELTNGEPALLVEKVASLILFKSGEGCVMPTDSPIKGELCLRIDSNDSAKPVLVSNSTIQGECKERVSLEATTEGTGAKDKLLYGAQTATVDVTANAFLIGPHAGLSLGASLSTLDTRLCKFKEGSCKAYPLETKISAGLEEEVKFVFPYEGEELEPPCRVSAMSGTATKEGEALTGELTALTFKECGGGLCTVTAQHLPYKFEVKATSEGNGTMTWSSGGSGSPAFTIKCLGIAKCIYGATEMLLTITGGTPAKLSSGGVALKREEGSEEECGLSGAKWEGIAAAEGKIQYKITAPSSLFVRLV